MKPSVAPVIENTFEERMRVMDVVDTVRDIQHDVNRVLGEEDNEKALVAQLRAIYESQGRDVDDSTIRQGLELYKSGRYEFEAPQEDLGLKLANLYITRDTWGPVLALRSVLSVALVALISGGVWGVGREMRRGGSLRRRLGCRTPLPLEPPLLPVLPVLLSLGRRAAGRAPGGC